MIFTDEQQEKRELFVMLEVNSRMLRPKVCAFNDFGFDLGCDGRPGESRAFFGKFFRKNVFRGLTKTYFCI
ncbi:MAG TPA: hypothetical protein DE060_13505 [Lentisphaeria bacterium]|nr:hypothetical protein [Lentisphaeria bacterium]HCG50207.1 hypothetical protein [Lentisphaeria bacterium]